MSGRGRAGAERGGRAHLQRSVAHGGAVRVEFEDEMLRIHPEAHRQRQLHERSRGFSLGACMLRPAVAKIEVRGVQGAVRGAAQQLAMSKAPPHSSRNRALDI